MSKNQAREQAENIQREIYKTKFKKPGFPELVRKSTNLFSRRFGCQIQINISNTEDVYRETFKLIDSIHCKPFVEITIKSLLKADCLKSRIIRNPSTRKDYNSYRAAITALTPNSDPYEDKQKLMDAFLNSIEKLMDKDFNFFCDKIDHREFYFALESDSLSISLEMFITL